VTDADGLNEMQARFCREFLVDLVATKAAERAGYSPPSAASQACELLKQPKIQDRIAELNAGRMARVQITADMVLQELMRIGTCDIGEAFDDNGKLLAIRDMPELVRRAVSSVETEELFEGVGKDRAQVGVVRKIKFWEKTKGLELLGKHLKLFTDRVEHSGTVTLEALVAGSNKKIEGD